MFSLYSTPHTPLLRFCRSTTTEGASSTNATCPSSRQKQQSSKPRTGNSKNGQLEERLQISTRDQSDVFTLYQKTEREKQALQSDADVLREIREHAPDKLKEAMETVRQRKLDKYRPKPFKSSGNHWSK